jgi:hypothetical protein
LVDQDAAGFEVFECLKGLGKAVCEDSSLKAEARVVCDREAFLEGAVMLENGDRGEGFSEP